MADQMGIQRDRVRVHEEIERLEAWASDLQNAVDDAQTVIDKIRHRLETLQVLEAFADTDAKE